MNTEQFLKETNNFNKFFNGLALITIAPEQKENIIN